MCVVIQGSVDVMFMRRTDEFQAMKRHNNLLLRGRSMDQKILDGNTDVAPVAALSPCKWIEGRIERIISIGYVQLFFVFLSFTRE